MPLSRYLKTFAPDGKEDRLLLFSTRTCSKILISKETQKAMEANLLSPVNEAALQRVGMLVNDRDEEKRSIPSMLEERNSKNDSIDIIAVLNLDCNFACKYCYEGDMKGRIYMDEGIAAALINFIRKRFDHGKKALHMDFYGGEPLLSLDLIRDISTRLNQFTKEINASFEFGLVTNGSLYKRNIAEELISLGLKDLKITLDGPAHIHNKSRPFKSGEGSFDIIIRNIKETWDLAKIAVGGNFEEDNYREFPQLLDLLISEGITPDKLAYVKFDPVMKRSDRVHSPMDFNEGCMSVNEQWLMDANLFLREEVLKRGFRTPGIKPMFCLIESNESYTVNHNGTLYKCPGFLGMEGFEIGDLKNGPRDCLSAYKPGFWNNSECMECEYLPLCYGGCRFAKFVTDGEINSTDCRRKYFDTCLEALIKQDIKYGIKAVR